eukprot:5608652-Pyramimonas_sp.AAC.1
MCIRDRFLFEKAQSGSWSATLPRCTGGRTICAGTAASSLIRGQTSLKLGRRSPTLWKLQGVVGCSPMPP